MQLKFSPPKQVETASGMMYVSEAPPTNQFWATWRISKDQMGEKGIYVAERVDDVGRKYWVVRKIFKKIADEIIPISVIPAPVKDISKLLPYQIPAVGHLKGSILAHKIAFDCSDTGTGKTYTSLKTCLELNMRPAIICTKTGIVDWKKVCNFFGLNPLFIINWESAKSPKFPYTKKVRNPYPIDEQGDYFFKWLIPHNANVCLIFDEVHRANGNGTQNQQLLMGARNYPMIGLSATLADKLPKLRAIGVLCGLFKEEDFNDWLREKGLFKDRHDNWNSLTDMDDMLTVHKYLFPKFGTRIKKMGLPGFPDIQNIAQLHTITNSTKQNKAYDKLKKQIYELKAAKGSEMQSKILVLQLRYKQLAEAFKVDLLYELIKQHQESGHSVAVFVNYTDTLLKLASKLKTKNIIMGGQKDVDRRKAIDDFQADKSHVILCNIKAGGIGISLHDLRGERSRVALICPTDTAIDLVQCMGRIHRAGAKSKAINYLVYAQGTIEEKVYANVVHKINVINTLNDGDMAPTEVFENG